MRRLAAGAAALTLAAGTAHAAARPSIDVDPATVRAGHVVRVFGNAHGCPRGDAVTLISRAFSHRHDFAGLPAISATVRGGGRFSVRTRIPRRRAAGRYAIRGRCGGGNLGVRATLRVRAPS